MIQKQTILAGVPVQWSEAGDFFRLLAAQATITVKFYRGGAEVVEVAEIEQGYAEEFGQPFDRVMILSAVDQEIHFVTRLGNRVAYDTPPNGDVTVTNVNGAFTQAKKTVTNASGQLLAANIARRYLLIQNRDASGDIYVTLDGTAATVAGGVVIEAGASMELQGFVPTGEIRAIGSIASNANVIVVEG